MIPNSTPNANGFFVVGTGRCGSTILRKLLRHHPFVYIPKETHLIPLLHDQFGERPISSERFLSAAGSVFMAKGKTALERVLKENELDTVDLAASWKSMEDRSVAQWMLLLYRDLSARNDATLWGDKTPDYGHCMTLLAQLYAGARFVHIERDGRDVALSMRKVLSFRYQVAWGVSYWGTIAWNRAYEARRDAAEGSLPLDSFFELWRDRTLRIRDEARRLDPNAFLTIRYEQLLLKPSETLLRLAEFLQLPERDRWIDEATQILRPDNLGRNRDNPEYRDLTHRYGEELLTLGFKL